MEIPTIIEGFGSINCRLCGRALNNPVSRLAGIGPVCRGKVTKLQREGNKTGLDPFDIETMDVTFRRKGTLGIMNIPQIHKHHSPTGMEWGYHGSGAADAALNILARFLPLAKAGIKGRKGVRWTLWDGTEVSARVQDLHQDFKRDFIATMPYAGGTITGETIRDWLMGKGVPAKEISFATQVEMI